MNKDLTVVDNPSQGALERLTRPHTHPHAPPHTHPHAPPHTHPHAPPHTRPHTRRTSLSKRLYTHVADHVDGGYTEKKIYIPNIRVIDEVDPKPQSTVGADESLEVCESDLDCTTDMTMGLLNSTTNRVAPNPVEPPMKHEISSETSQSTHMNTFLVTQNARIHAYESIISIKCLKCIRYSTHGDPHSRGCEVIHPSTPPRFVIDRPSADIRMRLAWEIWIIDSLEAQYTRMRDTCEWQTVYAEDGFHVDVERSSSMAPVRFATL